jgi:hypothetical protein
MFADFLFSRRDAGAQRTHEPDSPARLEARTALIVLGLLALAGIVLGWNKAQLPRRDEGDLLASGEPQIAPDLALYRNVIAEVRGGKNYYAVARERIPHYGFPIASPLNWRLPTYAWVLSRLPGPTWIQAALVLLSIAALALTFTAQLRTNGVGSAAVTTFLLFGVVRWAIDGSAYLAQEPWAATLIVVSLAAHGIGGQGDWGRGTGNKRNGWLCFAQHNTGVGRCVSRVSNQAWRSLAVIAGIGALLFRELALPYCMVAGAMAMWNRRWGEAAGWIIGIALFFGFFAWHVGQVKAQLAGSEVAASGGLSQWLRFGGLDFILLTTRMNSLLFAAPPALLWLYLLLSLVGLSHGRDEVSQLACLAALAYLLAFAVVGRPENFYWGLLPAPLLAWGMACSPQAFAQLLPTSCWRLASRER